MQPIHNKYVWTTQSFVCEHSGRTKLSVDDASRPKMPIIPVLLGLTFAIKSTKLNKKQKQNTIENIW